MSGPGRVLGTSTPIVAGAITLPNTGSNITITLAVSLAAGLVAWGALYAYANR